MSDWPINRTLRDVGRGASAHLSFSSTASASSFFSHVF